MSFEVYLQCFEAGEPTGMPRTAVRALFPVVEAQAAPDYWPVWYDDVNSCELYVTPLPSNHDLVHSLCVYRPCRDERLWRAILDVMRLGSAVLYFPADAPPLVADAAVIAHLPEDMIASLGQPLAVQSWTDIIQAIEGA